MDGWFFHKIIFIKILGRFNIDILLLIRYLEPYFALSCVTSQSPILVYDGDTCIKLYLFGGKTKGLQMETYARARF
jgi:hypothetical protein